MTEGSAAGAAALDLSSLDRSRLPAHVGLIMDGNGRWALARNLPRTGGHAAGETALFDCVEGALEIGLSWLSAYTFSTENWSRHPDEVSFLMWFNEDILLRRLDSLADMGVRICFAGDLADPRIPDRNRALMQDAAPTHRLQPPAEPRAGLQLRRSGGDRPRRPGAGGRGIGRAAGSRPRSLRTTSPGACTFPTCPTRT